MKMLALDQNIWSQLAQAALNPDENPTDFAILQGLATVVQSGDLIIPLTQSNIFETSKMSDLASLQQRSWLQATLSKGQCINSYRFAMHEEIRDALASHFRISTPPRDQRWFLTNNVVDAMGGGHLLQHLPDLQLRMHMAPQEALHSFMTSNSPSEFPEFWQEIARQDAALLSKLESQRSRLAQESLSMRRRALSASLFLDFQGEMWRAADALGISTVQIHSQPSIIKKMVKDVPRLHIERELRLVLERENRTLTSNDLWDMQFCLSTFSNMDIICMEKGFGNRAKQARLDEFYDTKILTDLRQLGQHLGFI